MITDNPWNVDSIEAFSCLKCPECDFNTKEEDFFQNHAVENHPLSFIFFGKSETENDTKVEETDSIDPDNSDNLEIPEDSLQVKLEFGEISNSKGVISNFQPVDEAKKEINDLKIEELKPIYNIKDTEKEKTCRKCGEVFKSKNALALHRKTVHKGKKAMQCTSCSYR